MKLLSKFKTWCDRFQFFLFFSEYLNFKHLHFHESICHNTYAIEEMSCCNLKYRHGCHLTGKPPLSILQNPGKTVVLLILPLVAGPDKCMKIKNYFINDFTTLWWVYSTIYSIVCEHSVQTIVFGGNCGSNNAR